MDLREENSLIRQRILTYGKKHIWSYEEVKQSESL